MHAGTLETWLNSAKVRKGSCNAHHVHVLRTAHLGIPIAVIDDAGVSSLQVDPKATSTGIEDVQEHVTAWLVEHPDIKGPDHAVGGAIQAKVPAERRHPISIA